MCYFLRVRMCALARTPVQAMFLPDSPIAPLPGLQLLVQLGLAVLPPRCEGLPFLVPVEGKQGDREAEGVEHLVLHSGEQDLQLLWLGGHRAGAEVGVSSYRSGKQQGHISTLPLLLLLLLLIIILVLLLLLLLMFLQTEKPNV